MPLTSPARACGIDFGTSNSTVGWLRPGSPTLLALEDGKATLPSVVFFNAEENTVSFGRAGLGEYLDGHEGRLMRSLKSLLGSSLIDGRTDVQGTVIAFRDLLTRFIGSLKERAETQGQRAFDQVVLGRPVFFVDDDAAADRVAEETLGEIARAVGFKDISFQFEPIAAAFHYETTLSREEVVLVADIGGGTSDFSIVRLSPQRAKASERGSDVLANGGVHIGGTDFDRQLSLASVMPLLGHRGKLKNGRAIPASIYFNLATWHSINFAYARPVWAEQQRLLLDAMEPEGIQRLLALIRERAGHWLAHQVEQAKIALSDGDTALLSLERFAPGEQQLLTRSEFDLTTGILVDKVESAVTRLLPEAGLTSSGIDTVFFTGGSSGIPQLRRRIAALLPQARVVEGDLFGSIGAGLAVDAARRYGNGSAA
ncbi:Hsp70 family protein [Quatrionicoccus australiensis]|uniref:Hsp70 family protein n=1 Tax=Quatrionicoccus australiensis TaxID=138118 RepID=UPI001CFA637C|nr:Hsp70 family protein [Quatrionicoccus australiensis]MCB4361859.1 Hsp70 family protein [Quatrionicoccus australiensis]